MRRAQALPNDTYQELETFANVLAIVQKNYVEPVTTKQLIDGAITGMLASLDPHSAYLTPDLYRDLEVETRGSFGGLGIEITIKNGVLTVVAPIEDTPAYRAGLKAGDQIIKIDDDFTKDMTLTDAVKRMRGPQGQQDQADASSRRRARAVHRHARARRHQDSIGQVQDTRRTATATCASRPSRRAPTTASRRRSTSSDKDDHGKIKGLVLDLRDNPGGLLNQAVKVSDDFLDGGLVVYTQGRRRESAAEIFLAQEERLRRLSDGGAGQRRQRQRQRNRRRRVAGSEARRDRRHPDLRQRLGADHPAARRSIGPAPDHGALLHSQRPLDPGRRHHA